MIYEKKFAVDGTPMYYKNGKRIKRLSIPKEELAQLEPVTVDEPVNESVTVESDIPDKKVCVFCGAAPTHQRFVNLQTVLLCEEDYYSKNVGKIAKQLKERELV